MNVVRKRLLSKEISPLDHRESDRGIDILSAATVAYSSERADFPVEHMFDQSRGRGGSRWIAAKPDKTDQIILEFDRAQSISRLVFEAEETEVERTQEVRIEALCDGESVYRTLLMQQYTFSPDGSTYQREDLSVGFAGVTRLRLTVVPNHRGHGSATLTSLQLFA
jgi:hypothetical protein